MRTAGFVKVAKKSMNKQKDQTLSKIWPWIKIASLLLGIISGSILVYQWWNRNQQIKKLQTQLAQKEQAAQQNYQEQKNYCELTTNLAKSPQIQAFFSDLLRNYAGKFAKSKKLDICFAETLFSHYPLNFGGFYQRENQEQGQIKVQYRKLGNCCFIPRFYF